MSRCGVERAAAAARISRALEGNPLFLAHDGSSRGSRGGHGADALSDAHGAAANRVQLAA